MNIGVKLRDYEDGKIEKDVEVEIADSRISVSLVDDHLEHADGSIEWTVYPRSIAFELRPDGGVNALLYRSDKEEPLHLILKADGTHEVAQ